MKSHAALSEEIQILHREFAPFETTGAALSIEAVIALRLRLSLLARLAQHQEQELAIHRLVDAGRFQATAIEKLTLETAGDLILAAEGNVLRPDFGRKP